jgi:hypothetical protein
MRAYNPKLKSTARALRTNLTDSEQLLWSHLRRKQILGVQFYRQKPLVITLWTSMRPDHDSSSRWMGGSISHRRRSNTTSSARCIWSGRGYESCGSIIWRSCRSSRRWWRRFARRCWKQEIPLTPFFKGGIEESPYLAPLSGLL